VRACVVVETHVLGDDASKMFLAEDEDVIEQLSAERARQALSEGIHVRRAYRGAHDAHARRREYASEASAELRVVVADKQSGAPSMEAFRACCAHHSSVGAYVTAA